MTLMRTQKADVDASYRHFKSKEAAKTINQVTKILVTLTMILAPQLEMVPGCCYIATTAPHKLPQRH